MVVIDSSFLVDLARGVPAAVKRQGTEVMAGEPLRVPAAVWIEYLAGIDRTRRTDVRRRLGESCLFEPMGREIADRAADLQADLLADGQRMPWHDLQVAATALHHGERILSRDTTFDGIPGLLRHGW